MGTSTSKALVAFADNLIRLMEASDGRLASPQQVADRSARKISQKTIKRITLKQNEPTLDTVEAIAKVFGYEAWQMLIPGLQPGDKPAVKRDIVLAE